MGVVWKARDPVLDREVAIKVLPEIFARDPERIARFEREARLLAALSHPHIAAIYGLHEAGGVRFLAMELVEGEDLAQRLRRGPLPVDEALAAARQIAEALEYAHDKGVIHRDLKPANIIFSAGGQVKLLDFGLAKALEDEAAAGPDAAQSPTLTARMTAANVLLGTAAYMSPEQARGSAADRRADIWAFGVVLFEMLAGRQLFEGETVSDTLASVLKSDPDWSLLPADTPPRVVSLLRRCLARDLRRRLRDVGEARIALEDVLSGAAEPSLAGAAALPAPVARPVPATWLWAFAGIAVLGWAVAGGGFVFRRAPLPEVTRFEVLGTGAAQQPRWPLLSPDGQQLAFLGTDSTGTTRIWIRPLDAIEAHPLAGTEGAGRPFWSPDGRFLAYFGSGKLRKVAIGGGPPVTIAEAPGGSDGSWGSRGLILFDGSTGDSIRMVPASGGEVKGVTAFSRKDGELQHAWPCFLPDGRHFVYQVQYFGGRQSTMKLGDVRGGAGRVLGESDGRTLYTRAGYLLFLRDRTLLAQRFDAGAGKLRGDPFPVAENVVIGAEAGNFTVSDRGDLAYRAEGSDQTSQLLWFDRTGKRLGEASPPGSYIECALSPDGTHAAVSQLDPANSHTDIWVRDLQRGVSTRLTFDPGLEIWPVWSPDGSRVAYASDKGGEFRVYMRMASGAGGEDSIPHVAGGDEGPTDWLRDGTRFLTSSRGSRTRWDIWTEPAAPIGKPTSWLQTPFVELRARCSPDGRWVAYESQESGHPEIYIRPASGEDGKWQVSTAGGSRPNWRADGKELFYETPDHALAAAPIAANGTLQIGTPVTLFTTRMSDSGLGGQRWGVTADGQRFLVLAPVAESGASRLTVVRNWATEAAHR